MFRSAAAFPTEKKPKVFKVLRYFKAFEWLLVAGCAAFVVLEVFLELKMPEYVGKITDCMTAGAPIKQVWEYGGYMLLCAFSAAVCLLIVGFLAALLGSRLARTLRAEIYDHVMKFSLADINKFSMATLITRSTNDVTQVQMLFAMGAQYLFRAPVLAIWAIIKVVQKSWQWTTLTAGAVAALILVSIVILLIALPKFKRIQLLTDDLNRLMREQLTGVRVVRAYNAEKFSEDKFNVANDDLTRTNLSVNRTLITINPLMNLAMSGVSIGVFWIGAYLIQAAVGDGRLVLFSDMMEMMQYTIQVLSGFLMIVMCFIMTPRALIAAKRITDVLIVEPSITDPKEPVLPSEEVKGEVEFRDVSFMYPDATECVLEHISFKAERGQTVAFIGSTGSGKSTLINLVPRFYDVTGGEILVDGVDVRDYSQKELRKRIGYIPQRGVLFSGTLEENINYGDLADERSESDVRGALDIAQATDFVSEMDGELQADIAQGGANVSGGQRQRLAIARAICRRPEIYIFDDSFSALDFKTDKKLREALAQATADATKLIVAQRVGTIMDADKIIVLDNGAQVGEGTHKELMENCEVYREIALSQLSKEELQ